MSVTFLKKKYDTFQRGSGKFYLNCSKRITKESPTTESWLKILRELKPTNFKDDNRVLLGVLEKHKNVVIKIGESMNLKKEYDFCELLEQRRVDGFVKFICYFSCNDNYKDHHGSTSTLCNGPGNKMKCLVMKYYLHGSIRDKKWTKDNFHILKSLLSQSVIAIINAYQMCGIIHNDLNGGNILIDTTKKSTLYDIPTHGYKIVIMDLENAIRVTEDVPKDNSIFVYNDIQHLINDISYRSYVNLDQLMIVISQITMNNPKFDESIPIILNAINELRWIEPPKMTTSYDPNVWGGNL